MELSKEEKQAIEMLDKFITEHKLFNIKQADNLEDNIQIILNLIEKQEREIEEADKIIDNSIEEQKEREKYTHSLEEKIENQKSTLELYCKNYGLQKDKIEKQSKVIDEIIQNNLLHIPHHTEVCRNVTTNDCNNFRNNGGCNNCIKQYFYRKVEEDE